MAVDYDFDPNSYDYSEDTDFDSGFLGDTDTGGLASWSSDNSYGMGSDYGLSDTLESFGGSQPGIAGLFQMQEENPDWGMSNPLAGQNAQTFNPPVNTSFMDSLGPKFDEATQKFLSNPDRWMSDLMKVVAATQERKKSKSYAKSLSSIASSPMLDPFGGQRGTYQDQMRQATLDPKSVPMIAQNLQAIQSAQDRKDAAAGRRSNQVGSAPAVLAAQNQSVMDYIKTMAGPAGANINPSSSTYAQLLRDSAMAGGQGDSAIYSALSNILQGRQNGAEIDKVLEALTRRA